MGQCMGHWSGPPLFQPVIQCSEAICGVLASYSIVQTGHLYRFRSEGETSSACLS